MRSQSPPPSRQSGDGPVLFPVLGALLTRLGQTVTADRLAEAVWSDDQPLDPRAALYSLAYRLRRVVERIPRVELRTTPPGYALIAARDAALRSEDLITAARRAGAAVARDDDRPAPARSGG